MTTKIIVVINVVIKKTFFPIFGFCGAPGSIPPIFSLKTSLFDRIPIGNTEKNDPPYHYINNYRASYTH